MVFPSLNIFIISGVDRLWDELSATALHRFLNIELPPLGRKVVERMQSKGMVVDIAHMGMFSLAGLAKTSQAPVIDSHTHTAEKADLRNRVRSYKDVEHIVKTGGVVCTWSYAH